MDGAYIGEIRMFSGNFAPADWAFCDGQIMQVRQNTALFAVLGAKYGGDGVNNFGLPNLGSKIPIGTGTGPGLTKRSIGESGGATTYKLDANSMPAHSHTLFGVTEVPTSNSPVGAFLGSNLPRTTSKFKSGAVESTMVQLDATTIKATGQGLPVSNVQPYLTVSFIICLLGEFPQRP